MRSCKRNGVVVVVALGCGLVLGRAAPAAAQETVTAARAVITETAVIGGPTLPTSGVLRLVGVPARTAGQSLLSITGAGDVTAGALAKADLPAAIAYEDEANTFAVLQTLSAGLATTTIAASGLAALNGGTTTTTLAASGLATFNGIARSLTYTSQTTGWAVDAAGRGDFRRIYTDELHAREFIADLEMALNGGQTIAKSTVVLALPFTCPAAAGTASIRVRDFPGFPNLRVFAVNDWIVLRSFSRTDGDADGLTDLTIGDCVGQVSAYADQTDDTQTWTFARGAGGNAGGMSTGTVIAAEALVVDYGVSGQGFLVARANDGAEGANSPYWQVNTWTTAPVAANMAARMRCGNLNGSYSYVAAAYGCAFGDPAAANLTIDPINGLRFRNGATDTLTLTGSALNLVNAGVIKSGAASALATGAGIWIDAGSGTPTFRIGDPAASYLRWNGAILALHETMFCLTCPGTVGSLDIDSNGLAFGATDGAPPSGGATVYAPAVTFTSAGTGASGLVGYTRAGTTKGVALYSDSGSGRTAEIVLQADNYTPTFQHAALKLTAGPTGGVRSRATLEATEVELLGVAKLGQSATGATPTVGVFAGNMSTSPGHPWLRGDTNVLVVNAPGGLYFNYDVSANTWIAGVGLLPATTNAIPLGAASYRWSDIYFAEPTTTAVGLFPLVSNAGRIMAKSNGLNGTTTCAGAQRVSAITFAFGIATAITCS